MAITRFNYNIRWNEFREINQHPRNISEDAEIYVDFSLNYSTRAPDNQDCHVTAVTTALRVNRGKSWVVKNKKTAALLRHEQGHYDITALGAREVYQRILALTAAQCPQIDTESRRIQEEVQRLISLVNIRYDTRTSHGINSTVQQSWELSIHTAKQRADGVLANLPQ